ncbi:MAG: ABC transporter ATP-binding protein [Sulfolobales archaeon]
MSILYVSDLVKKFGSVVALNMEGRSLGIEKGEIFVVIGPSGSGKTTFLRCIAGLETPDKGEIVIGGKEVFSYSKGINLPPEKRSVGYVPQTWGLWPHMKVWDNIAFGLKIKKMPREEIARRVKSVAESLKIDHLLDRYPWQLSGGQQQRVALARAIVLEPSLLLLDEPISNLDAALRDEARIWLRETIKSLRITSIYVTHDIREAFALGDRIALISDGLFRKVGTPSEIYRSVDDPVLASLLRFNIVRGRVVRVYRDSVEVDIGGATIKCTARGDLKEGSDALIYFSPRDVAIGDGDLEVNIISTTFSGEYYEAVAELGGKMIRIYMDRDLSQKRVKARIERCIASNIYI